LIATDQAVVYPIFDPLDMASSHASSPRTPVQNPLYMVMRALNFSKIDHDYVSPPFLIEFCEMGHVHNEANHEN